MPAKADNKAATEQLATTQALTNDSLRAVTAENKDSLDMKPVVYHIYVTLAFLSIAMTYFGVNFFLTGMHSYA